MRLADILRERHELDAALDRATRGVELAQDVGAAQAERWIEWQVCNLLVLARIRQAQGDLDGALAAMQEAQEQLDGYGASACAAILAAFEAQVRLAQGDFSGAVRCLRRVEAREAPPKFGLTPQVFVYAFEHLEIAPAQVLLAQGRASRDPALVRRALALLDGLGEKAERTRLAWLHAKTLALQAVAYRLLGETAPALAALERALALAGPAGYVRLFVDEGPPMADLLRRLRTHDTASDHVAALLAALESPPQREVEAAVRPEVGASLHTLTERELEVLRLLAAGQSNPEIARALYVEINTVKTHVKHLYGKLGAHGRVQAIRRARELGIL